MSCQANANFVAKPGPSQYSFLVKAVPDSYLRNTDYTYGTSPLKSTGKLIIEFHAYLQSAIENIYLSLPVRKDCYCFNYNIRLFFHTNNFFSLFFEEKRFNYYLY